MSHRTMLLVAFLSSLTVSAGGPNELPPKAVQSDSAGRERAVRHYAEVERELLSRDVSDLDPAQRAERERLIGVLAAYRERGDFGRQPVPGARIPQFVDDEGRRCAVAELLHASGQDALVEHVRVNDNTAWVVSLESNAAFQDWLDRSGLEFLEAVRIQVPSMGGSAGPGDPGSESAPSGPPPTYSGPGDTGRAAPTGASPSGPGAPASGPSTPRGAGDAPSASPTTPPKSAGDRIRDIDTGEGWWRWWEYNKLEFLVTPRAPAPARAAAPNRTQSAPAVPIDPLRRTAFELFRGALGDPDAATRAAAIVALARSEGRTAVADVLPLLKDPSVDVRRRAILALGATGAPEAREPLFSIARTGGYGDALEARLAPEARSLALVALALCRRAGLPVDVAADVVAIARAEKGSERDEVLTGAFLFHCLAPSPEVELLAFEVAGDERESAPARCRAAESLRSAAGPDALPRLQHLASGRRLDLRRSAALAVGHSQNPAAASFLMTAYELEAELLTRGFLLISLGRQGGDEAREFLLRALEHGDRALRPWAALALGLLARGDHDPRVGAALLEAQARERSPDAGGALTLALGLAREAAALAPLGQALTGASDARMRTYAATGLALVGGAAARDALLARTALESNGFARVGLAQSLGFLHDPADASVLFGMVRDLRDPTLAASAAVALGVHGSERAMPALAEIARAKTSSNAARAAAVEGLGLALSIAEPLSLSEASRSANFTLFPAWVDGILQSTL